MKEKKQYRIRLNKNTEVPVSQEVYRAYIRPKWRERKQAERNKRLISLDEIGEEALAEQSVPILSYF